MVIHCPYCRHAITFKRAKPGRYRPRCPKCAGKFVVTIPGDPEAKPIAAPLAAETAAAERQPEAAVGRRPEGSEESQREPQATMGGEPPRKSPETTADGKTEETGASGPGPAATTPTIAPVTAGSQKTGERTVPASEGPSPHLQPTAAHLPQPPEARPTEHDSTEALTPGAPRALGGYRIINELGQGAMGTVYLARQISLNRTVALKTIQARASDDPQHIARFIREAYAAAQLVHHNVVQIYDLGEDGGTHYFSMEYVEGAPLSEFAAPGRRLDVETAVGYVLQAARGLKFAHDHGMVHRDVKPSNLLLNNQGIVKVADLGLVKTSVSAETPGDAARLTRANVGMGTPAFMAPEQADDVASVDKRADVYSLGCTLYALLTGRPPFVGASSLDVIIKHKTERAVPPDAVVKQVPKELSDVAMKMMAKKPDDRYADLDEVIKELEQYLGVQRAAAFSPREEHVETLESCLNQFHASPAARLRSRVILGFFAACGLLLIGGVFLGHTLFAGGIVGLALLTTVWYFVFSGSRERTYLFDKVNELIFSSSWRERLTWLVGLGLLLVGLAALDLLWVWLAFCALALGLALALCLCIDRRAIRERAEPIERMETMLKGLRVRGLEESALQQFVARHAGDRWEEFYEVLFGYEAKIAARHQWGRGPRGRRSRKFRAWRDPIIDWIDARLRTKREDRKQKHLQRVEAAARAAVGQAVMAGEALTHTATAAMETAIDLASGVFHQRGRFILGCILMTGCVLWMHQNEMVGSREAPPTQAPPAGIGATEAADLEAEDEGLLMLVIDLIVQKTKPLSLPGVPLSVTGWFDSYNVGVAGLILMMSLFITGAKISWFLFPATAVMIAGHRMGIPEHLPLPSLHAASLAIGIGLVVLGLLFGRE